MLFTNNYVLAAKWGGIYTYLVRYLNLQEVGHRK